MRYLLDANTYIQAKNQYYGMDICPAYWDWLDQQFLLGVVGSVNMIARELKDGNDELAVWVKDRPAHFISNDDQETQAVFTEIVQTVINGDYNQGNRDNFLAKADPWIIAKAKAIGATVVTHESFVAANTKKSQSTQYLPTIRCTLPQYFSISQRVESSFCIGLKIRERNMEKKLAACDKTGAVTISTALLNQKQASSHGYRMLTASEIILLRKSKQEIAKRFNAKR